MNSLSSINCLGQGQLGQNVKIVLVPTTQESKVKVNISFRILTFDLDPVGRRYYG